MSCIRISLLILVVVFTSFGCKNIEKLAITSSVERDMRETIMNGLKTANYPQYLLADRIDVKVEAEDNYNAKMTLYLDKGNSIFISLRFVGFEIMRAKLTSDSIKYINRLKQEYYFEDFSKMKGLPEIVTNMDQLQNLIYSGFFYSDNINKKDFVRSFQKGNEQVVYDSKVNESNIRLIYNLFNFKLDKIFISDEVNRLTAEFDIDRDGDKINFINGGVTIKRFEILMDMSINRTENKEYRKTDFAIGKNYKKLEKLF